MRQAADGIREVVDGFDAEAVDGSDARRQGSGGVIDALKALGRYHLAVKRAVADDRNVPAEGA